MAVFAFKGKNKVGMFIEGVRTGRNVNEVMAMLEKEQIKVLNVEKKRPELSIPFLGGRKSVKLREISVFNRQLSVMFNSGLPITQSLAILGAQQENKYFKDVLNDIKKDVEGGSNFSNALRKHPKVFSELYTSMIQAGEASGNLDTVLVRLSKYIEDMTKLIGKVKSAMAYPIAVLIIAAVLGTVIMTNVVPVFQDMFDQLDATLPLPTRIVVAISEFMQNNFLLIVVVLVAIVFGVRAYNKTYKGKRIFDKIKLKLPIFGTLLMKVAVARVTRTLETLLESGVEIIESLTITAKTAGNSIVRDSVLRSRSSIQEGKLLGEAWQDEKVFPLMVSQMVIVGEETGAITNMLGKIADFYEEEVDQAVAGLLSLMEPIMIVILGGVIGSIVIAMYLPMFDILGKIG